MLGCGCVGLAIAMEAKFELQGGCYVGRDAFGYGFVCFGSV